MFDDTQLERLLQAMRQSGVSLLEIEGDQGLLRLSLPLAAPQPMAAPAPATPATETARSPEIGRFLPRGGDDGLAALAPGDAVQAGETLGYVLRGSLRAAITAPRHGRIAADLPLPDAILGYGDPVFTLEVEA